MPQENSYESRLEELKTRETEIRQRLAQIAEERTSKMNDVANVYGVNATEVNLGVNTERQKLQEELAGILKEQGEIFETRRQTKIDEDKKKREERQAEINRKGKLQQAYKFFTYLDTATTKGYDLNGLTEEDILALYDDFMTKPEYEQIKRETLDRAMKNDRKIVIPVAIQTENFKEKESNENKQTVSKFSEETVNNVKNMMSLADIMKKPEEQKEETAIVKYEKPEGVEDTPLEALPEEAKETKLEEPKPGLLKRAKNWIKDNKKKMAIIAATAVVALGIAAGAIAHSMTAADEAVFHQTTQFDPSSISDILMETPTDANQVSQTAEAAANVDPSALDFSQQQFDPSILSGQGKEVHTTAADAANNANPTVTNEWYQIDGASLIGPDGTTIDPSTMTNGEVEELLNTGDYTVATTHDGVGMGFESSENTLEKMVEAQNQGGRSI